MSMFNSLFVYVVATWFFSKEYMLLSNNALTGTIPSEIVFLQSLVQLRLDSNDLDGLVPSTIGNITSLTLLKINDNM